MWMMVERHEQELRTSSKLITDERLGEHLRNLTCQTVGERCNEIRVYAIRTPGFNAFMMPNGAMFVQSGLLLRVSDDAELGAVLGHEVSHYSRRHSLAELRRWRKTTSAFAVASALVGAASNVAIGSSSSLEGIHQVQNLSATAQAMIDAAGIVAMYQLFAYSREQERQADVDGIEWMHEHGMDTGGAERLWKKVVAEQAAGGQESGFSLLASHPAPEERLAYLAELSGTMRESPAPEQFMRQQIDPDQTIVNLINPYREDWLSDEYSVQSPAQFAAIVEEQIKFGVSRAWGQYMTAKSWITYARNKKGRVLSEALNKADSALSSGDADLENMPPEAYREWAKLKVKLGDMDAAKGYFQRYLDEAPEAWDASFIRRELEAM